MSERQHQKERQTVRYGNRQQAIGARLQPYPEQTRTSEQQKEGRSTAEWVSLIVSSTIVLGLVVAIVYLYLSGGTHGAVIEVRPEVNQVRQEAGGHYLPVTIENVGGDTAEDVMVEVTFTGSDGQEEVSEVTIDFLAAQATEDAVVVFSVDPREGEVTSEVISYLSP